MKVNNFTSKYIMLFFGDLAITFLSVYFAVILRHIYVDTYSLQDFNFFLPKAVAFSLVNIFICFFMDLYGIGKGSGRKEIILKIMLAGFVTFFALSAVYYLFQVPLIQLGRITLFVTICIAVLLQSIWHNGHDLFLKHPFGSKKVLILGTGQIAMSMGDILCKMNNGLALSGYVNCIGEPVHVKRDLIIGNGDRLYATAMKEKVHKIVISLNERRGTLPMREVLNCKLKGIDVIDGPSFYEQLTGKLLIESMNPSHLIFSDGFRITVFRRYIKRAFDMLLALIGIVLSAPIMAIVPILIKLESRGPILYKQNRLGEGEKIFKLYKFRTMMDGAEKDSGPVWSQVGDTRITKIGKLLRKTRIDEIPQLINVIRGDMSFIGPRPERQFFVESLKKNIPYYSERHCVKPGITGWAQVRYEYGDSIGDAIEKLKYDLYYIKHQSISLDLLIVLDTLKVILFRKGGR